MYQLLTPERNINVPFELIEERVPRSRNHEFSDYFNNICSVICKDLNEDPKRHATNTRFMVPESKERS